MIRLLLPLSLLLPACAGSAELEARQQPQPTTDEETCSAAAAYIDHLLRGEGFDNSKLVILNTKPEEVYQYSKYARDLFKSSHPLGAAYRQLERRQNEKVHEVCPDLFRQFERLRLRNENNEPPESLEEIHDYEVIYLSLSVPGISSDGQKAVLAAGVVFAPLDGFGVEASLIKDSSGHWQFETENGTWVS